jgi:hypothetical protein
MYTVELYVTSFDNPDFTFRVEGRRQAMVLAAALELVVGVLVVRVKDPNGN